MSIFPVRNNAHNTLLGLMGGQYWPPETPRTSLHYVTEVFNVGDLAHVMPIGWPSQTANAEKFQSCDTQTDWNVNKKKSKHSLFFQWRTNKLESDEPLKFEYLSMISGFFPTKGKKLREKSILRYLFFEFKATLLDHSKCDQIYRKDTQWAETNENSIFWLMRILVFEIWLILCWSSIFFML